MDRPLTTWKDRKHSSCNQEEGYAAWKICKNCGKADIVFIVGNDNKDYVCKSCKEKEEEIVSMRCLRHKKRMNVPKWWLGVCNWLCPSCYERLTAEDRGKYKPADCATIKVKYSEVGKPTIFPKNPKEEYICKSCATERAEEKIQSTIQDNPPAETKDYEDTAKKDVERGSKKKGRRHGQNVPSGISTNPKFAGLLPTYRIKCQKCGDEAPCHYSWFTQSTVLCPTCYGQMSRTEIKVFHETHMSEKPKFETDTRPTYSIPKHIIDIVDTKVAKVPEVRREGWTRDSSMVNSGGCWSNSRIQSASASELKEAVTLGKVSKARYRIEMRRRSNVRYYDMCPAEVGIAWREIF